MSPPAWLEAFQHELASAIRTPLERRGELARARTDRYSPALCSSLADPVVGSRLEGLAHYNRQYWFRLVGALQREYPTVVALCGTTFFNELAIRFFTVHAPTGHDLGDALVPFASFVASDRLEGAAVPERAVRQAATIDRAFRRVFEARSLPSLDLRAIPTERLQEARLVRAECVQIIDEDWELIALRRSAAAPHAQTPNTRVARAHWAIARSPSGPRLVPLAREQARLYALLEEDSLVRALERLDREVSDVDGGLSTRVRAWMAQGIELGLWSSLVERGE